MPSRKTVFVTGANGFIGNAVARIFAQRGWTTYGLIRNERSALDLMRDEIIPLVGIAGDDTSSTFLRGLPPIDVIVTCDEDLSDYVSHHKRRLSMIIQLCKLSKAQQEEGGGGVVKPLVIFSSGCKDFGMTAMHGEVGLAPHTETSALNPPGLLRPRTEAAMDMLTNHGEYFDCVVTRPTTLFGRSGSYYSYFFALAERAKEEFDSVLELPANPNAVLHGTHIDDLAEAYLTLATSPRQLVAGQSFNISGHRYETLGEIVAVMGQIHGIKIKYREPRPEDEQTFGLYILALFSFPQWVASDKIRMDLGWSDAKPLFHEGYEVYRKAYEAAKLRDPQQVERVMGKKAPGVLQAQRAKGN